MHTSSYIYIFLLHHYASLCITCLHYMHLAHVIVSKCEYHRSHRLDNELFPVIYGSREAVCMEDKLFPLFLSRNINGGTHANLHRFNYVFLWRIFCPEQCKCSANISLAGF